MKKSHVILGCILIFLILLIAGVKLYTLWITPNGKSVSLEQFKIDSNKIIKQEQLGGTIFWDKNNIPKYFEPLEIKDSEEVVWITVGNKAFKDVPKQYNEIRVNVRIWLYIKNHQMPFDVYATYLSFSKTLQGESSLSLTFKEFNKIYDKNVVAEMSYNEIVDKLTNIIIQEKNYKRAPGSEFQE